METASPTHADSIIRIGMIGAGKITIDQHVPAVRADPRYLLQGAVSPDDGIEGVGHFHRMSDLFAFRAVDAVAINTPPQVRFDLACEAIAAGKHVLLEKPPCASVAELDEVMRRADAAGVTVYTAWHSQHAPAVPIARDWLASRAISAVRVQWCEDVRRWHPGQRWIWEAGGLGVFDPGINALSILTAVLPSQLIIAAAELMVPANCQTPIAAMLDGTVGGSGVFQARFDFLQTGPQTWSIEIDTDAGDLALTMGGARLAMGGEQQTLGESREYEGIYSAFAEMIGRGTSEIDARPLALAADAHLIARRTTVDDYVD